MNRLLAAFVLVVCCGAANAAQRAAKPVVHTVVIDAAKFSPATLTIRPGDSVEWVNKDVIAHTATREATKDGFESGVISPGKSWRRTFKTASELAYVCRFHPTMKGTLQVRK